eukprot:jgi/Chlat1/9273/Chrsp99S08533
MPPTGTILPAHSGSSSVSYCGLYLPSLSTEGSAQTAQAAQVYIACAAVGGKTFTKGLNAVALICVGGGGGGVGVVVGVVVGEVPKRVCVRQEKLSAIAGGGEVEEEGIARHVKDVVDECNVSGLTVEQKQRAEKNRLAAAARCCQRKAEQHSSSLPVFPPPPLLFHSLNLAPLPSIKVVVLGQDPYHSPGQAMGLSFSVPEGVRVPSSLGNVFKEMEGDLEGWARPKSGDLTKVCSCSTPLQAHQANSHAKRGWEHFTDAVIRTLATQREGIAFLLIVDEKKHLVLRSAHPSGLSANRGFFGCRHFSKVNAHLVARGLEPINWQL